jgi:hypothetical protein
VPDPRDPAREGVADDGLRYVLRIVPLAARGTPLVVLTLVPAGACAHDGFGVTDARDGTVEPWIDDMHGGGDRLATGTFTTWAPKADK